MLLRSVLMSRARAPISPTSSLTVKTTSTGRMGCPLARAAWSDSRMAATPALSSAPKTVVPSLRITPASSRGRTPRPGSTVSRCALRMIGSAVAVPSSRPMMLCLASVVTAQPRSRKRWATTPLIAASSPEGLSILASEQNVSTSRFSWTALVGSRSLITSLLQTVVGHYSCGRGTARILSASGWKDGQDECPINPVNPLILMLTIYPSSRPTAASTAAPSADGRSHVRSSRRAIVTVTRSRRSRSRANSRAAPVTAHSAPAPAAHSAM